MRLGKAAVVHFFSQTVSSFAGFAATFAIAYLLGPDGLGQYSIAVALGFFWLLIPIKAVGASIKKRMSEGVEPAKFLGAGLALNAGIAAVITACILTLGMVLDPQSLGGSEFIRVLTTYDIQIAVLFVSGACLSTLSAVLHGEKRVGSAGMVKATERVARTAIQVAVLLVGAGVAAITLGHAVSLALTAIGVVVVFRARPERPGLSHIRSLVEYARYAWIGTLRGQVFGWLDTIVLSLFVTASLVGIYEASWGIASLLAMASGSIGKALFPEVSELSLGDNDDRITHYLDEALAFTGIFIIPGFFGAFVLGNRVLTFYRPEFGKGSTILLLLILAYAADVYASQFLNVINAMDHPDRAYRINTVFIGVNAVLNVVLIPSIGWHGAALATTVSSALRSVFGYRVLNDLLGTVRFPFRTVGSQLLAAVLMAVTIVPVVPMVSDNRLGTLILVAFGAVQYVAVLLLVSERTRGKVRMLAPV